MFWTEKGLEHGEAVLNANQEPRSTRAIGYFS